MSYQVIPQPSWEGEEQYYAVFSSFSDSWVAWNHTRQDVIEFFVERAAKDARDGAERLMDQVQESPTQAYYQFTLSFREANAMSIEHGGPDLTKEQSGATQEP